jgi:DNA polymerase-3 subunit delta
MPALAFDLLKPEEALARLERGENLPGVIACLGAEPYFHRLVLEGVEQAVSRKLGQPAERIAYAAGESWIPAEVTAPLSALSLFGQGSVVKIGQSEGLTVECCEELWRLVPPEADQGLLLVTGERLPKGFSPPSGWLVTAETPRRERLQDWWAWVDRIAQARGVRLDAESRSALVESAETLAEIEQEIEKLSLVASETGLIEKSLVDRLGTGRVHASIFELLPALADRKSDEALAIVRSLLQDGEESVRLLAFLANEWNLLWEGRGLSARRAPSAEAMRQLGISSGRWYHVERTAKRMTGERFEDGIEAMWEADVALKTGDGEAGFIWERLVFRLCGFF